MKSWKGPIHQICYRTAAESEDFKAMNRSSLPACIPNMLSQISGSTPSAIALAAQGASLSYGELDARVGALAARLRAKGVGASGLVAVCLPRSIDQIVSMLAAWRTGAAYLPIDPAWPDARIAELIADAGCSALIANAPSSACLDGNLAFVSPFVDQAGEALAHVAADPDSIAYVIFTSGSTGKPKAVEVTHANLSALIDWHNAAFNLTGGTRTSHLAGLGFDASAWEVWPTLAMGGTLVLVDDAIRLDPAELRDWLVKERIEIAFAPTVLAEPMVTMAWPADTALRFLLTGADKLTVRPSPNQPFTFVNNYGPTESTVVATSGTVAADGAGIPSIGCPIAGTTIHLLDPAQQPVAEGEPGEIWIGGAQVARGYRGDEAMTRERFVEHPVHGRLYRTGDLGVRLDNGEIAFQGRVDGQVKVRGHRIEPAEISAALNRLPEISTSVVIARDGELIAYVVPEEGAAPTASGLREALSATLPDYMVPGRFASLAALPLTPNGKVDHKALPDPDQHAIAEAPAGRAPSTPTEKRLLDIVSGVIGRQNISIDDDFFLIGGHSLLGTQVVVNARDAFGIELTLFHLFEGRTVATLATVVERLIMEKLDSMSDEDIRRMAAG
jgi:amino acid adenylation domain-containing protein